MSLLAQAPCLSAETAARVAWEHYKLKASARPLPSERDQNFLLETRDGQRFVLKVANAREERAMLEAQNQVLAHLARRLAFCPRVLPGQDGEILRTYKDPSGAAHYVRLVTYLPGTPLGSLRRQSEGLLVDVGAKVGELSAALAEFDHPALHRDFHWDLANAIAVIGKYRNLIVDAGLREAVSGLAERFERECVPLLIELPRSILHNDANDYNLLVGGGEDLQTRRQTVVGLIDFGDMVHSYRAGELAVACAYATLDKPDPLASAACVVRGFHATSPLSERELEVLFGLICMRLCMSACLAAQQAAEQPENAYLGISQEPILRALPRLAGIHPRLAEAAFRHACGLHPWPQTGLVKSWLGAHRDRIASPLETNLRSGEIAVLDLGMDSPIVEGDPGANEEERLTPRIQAAIAQAGARIGLGRYDEARYFYFQPAFAASEEGPAEHRTLHLGVDLFAPQGTPVYAPLAGVVHAVGDKSAPGDYGPVVVLEHSEPDQPTFYTLYGHLSRASLKGLRRGQRIPGGGRLGAIGTAGENGGWTPHLHLQVIADTLGLGADFPGVAPPGQRELWLGLCPDPNLLLGIPTERFPPRPPRLDETLLARRERLGRNLSISYRQPLKIVRGWRQHLYDQDGRRYLDAYNNVAHVGHCHPRVVNTVRRQAGILNTNTRYLHDLINRYSARLAAELPEPLRVCFFVNSGSEANELALRLARAYTGARELIVLESAYHGNTTTLIDISPYKHDGPGGGGAPDWVHAAPIPDDYRGKYKRGDPEAGPKYAAHVAEVIAGLQADGRRLSGFIAESLPSVGGQIVPPPGYLRETYRHVRAAGGVCIADEVQTGFGRVGTHFWGFELGAVIPDIVVLGKPIGNGHPLGAVITTPEIAGAFDNGMEFFSTFGGNPVSCAAGLEVLAVVQEEGLQEHARVVGARLLDGLRPLVERFAIVGDVRGAGLFVGVELVRDRETLEPATGEAAFVADRMRDLGVLLGTDGPYHNVIKIRPPMPFEAGDCDLLVRNLERILWEDFDNGAPA